MKKVIILLLFLSGGIGAQTTTVLFEKANDAYKKTNYEEAIDLYKKIEEQQLVSSTLYFNLGNSYYKINDVASTIYYYEKALILNPLNKDAATNLEFAKRMTIDTIEELPKTFFQRFEVNYIKMFSYNQWGIISVVFSFLAALLFLLFYFTTSSGKKRLFFITSVFSFLLLLISIGTAFNQYNKAINTKYAIIFAPKAIIKNAPTENAEEVFTLHEGTKINVLDAVDNWKKIRLADGKIGWISADDLKEI